MEAIKALYSRDAANFRLLAQLSRIMAQSRMSHPFQLSTDAIRTEVEMLKALIDVTLADTASSHGNLGKGHDRSSPGTGIHTMSQRALGVALATKAILICVQRTLMPQISCPDEGAVDLSKQVLEVVEEARICHPLGAVWTVHTLICMWCAVKMFLKRQILRLRCWTSRGTRMAHPCSYR